MKGLKLELSGFSEEDLVRSYANDIRKRLIKHDASINSYISNDEVHYWLVSKGNIFTSGKTPLEAVNKLEEKLKVS